MGNDLNNCNFIGRLGNNPDSRFLPDGKAVTSISIAVGWKGKDKEGTEWVPVTAFGKLAEIMSEYLTKGSQVYISGRFKTDKYQAQDGTDRYSTKIIADRMQMLGGKQEAPAAAKQPAPVQEPQSRQQQMDDLDQDIPFMNPYKGIENIV